MATLVLNYGKTNDFASMLPELAGEMVVFTQNALPDPGRYAHYEEVPRCEEVPYAELRAYEFARHMSFDRVLTCNEFDLERAGRLRERFGLSGQSAESARAFRDKVLMKELANRAVAVPPFARLESIADLLELIEKNGYPIVIKPVDQGGSRDISVLRSYDDLVDFSRQLWRTDLMAEGFVDGDIYHVDAIIAPEFQFVSSGIYYNAPLNVIEGNNLGCVQLHPAEPMAARLRDFLETLLRSLPCPDIAIYHLEVFHTPDDRLLLCEIAARPGGGRIPILLRHTYGIDIKETWFRLLCGLELRALPERTPEFVHTDIAITPRDGTLTALPGRPPFPWVVDHVVSASVGQPAGPIKSCATNICYSIVQGSTSGQLMDRMLTCESWLGEQIKYEADRSSDQ
jgi:ATP-grasp domain